MTRYSWVTPEILKDPDRMPLALFYQLARMSAKFKREEQEEEYAQIAVLSWQIGVPHGLSKHYKLKKWVDMFTGKSSGDPTEEINLEAQRREIERIMALDTQRTASMKGNLGKGEDDMG